MARTLENNDPQGMYQEKQGFDLTAENDVLARLQQIRQSLSSSLLDFGVDQPVAETSCASDSSSAPASVADLDPAAISVSAHDFCDLDDLDRFLSTCALSSTLPTVNTNVSSSQSRTSRFPLPREVSLCDFFVDEPAEANAPLLTSASASQLHATYPQTQTAPAASAPCAQQTIPQATQAQAVPTAFSQTAVFQNTPASTSSSNPFARFLPPTESESAVSPESQRQASVPSVAKWGQDFQYFAAGGIACGAVLLGLGYRDASSVMSVWQLGVSLLIAGSVSLLCSFACMASARPKRS